MTRGPDREWAEFSVVSAREAEESTAGRVAQDQGLDQGVSVQAASVQAGTWDNPETDVTGTPPLLVDLNVSGRPLAEVNEIGYEPWVIEEGASRTFDGVTFSFSGTMQSTYHKASVQEPNYIRLAGDGVRGGATLTLNITGLSPGPHSLLSYHNHIDNPETNSFQPISVSVNGDTVVNGLEPTARETNANAATSFVTFNGPSVEIVYSSSGFVFLNGFALDVSDATKQARNPRPAHADEHVDADGGSVTLSWDAAPGAVSHNVYIGTNPDVVQYGDESHSAFRGNQTGTTFEMGFLYSMYTYYWRIDEVDAQGAVTRGNLWYFRPRQLAFPGAEGYGRFARGGRGGKVVYVTNLNATGAGSLHEAVTNDVGPRTILFAVSGVIELDERLVLGDHQTAPAKGITIARAPVGFTGNDLVVRNLRVRVGYGTTYDGMGLTGSDHSIIDRSSISWTIDEGFSSRNARNITLQRTMISECLNIADHSNYPAGTAHGYAASIGGDVGSFHHNLLAHCSGRNWSLAGGLDGDGFYKGRLDIFNNVVYNWDSRTTDGGAHEVNFVGNYYKPGAATSTFTALNPQYDGFPGTQQYYMAGNVMPGSFGVGDQLEGTNPQGSPPYDLFVDAPFFPSYAEVHSAEDAFKRVLSDVGATHPVLDDHDQRVIEETLEGTTTYSGSESGIEGLPDRESDVGGLEDYPEESRPSGWDTDLDGLPDLWEAMLGTSPSSPSGDFTDSNSDPDLDGYTALDDYLNWLAEPHYFTSANQQMSVDLSDWFRGFDSSPTFSVTAGSATISGSTATFTPNECGLFSFTVQVQDAEGSTMTRTIGVLADGC
jgi:hypothetical protein